MGIERDPVDVVAEFLHTGGPPLNADDAAVAIIGALAEAGFEVVPAEQLRGAVEALKLIACARAQSGQHAIDVGLARNALEAMGVDPSLWRGQ